MDVDPMIFILIWAGTGALAVLGLALIGAAMQDRPASAGGAATQPVRCACCGYDSSGLEHGICPECGVELDTGGAHRTPRARASYAMGGLATLLLASAGPWVDHAARHGVVHAMPTEVLAIVGTYVSAVRPTTVRHLLGHSDAHGLSASERRRAAEVARRGLLTESKTGVRRSCAELLAETADAAPEGAVELLLRDRDAEVRALGVRGLSRMIRPIEGECAMGARVAVATRLGRLALHDPSERVRRSAVDELGEMTGFGPRVQVLVDALEDSSRSVRMRALFALSRESSLPTTAVLAASRRLMDEEQDVRLAAMLVLKRARG